MGLAAPKKKIKLSHDPNNTRWTSDKSSFGHKIMTNQGWQPGDYLGVKDAAHAEFHTAANASHIRVSIKDDNLGLGAKLGTGVGHGECTGLDAFKDLLGRLNGKDEDEIEKEQRQRDDIRRAIYTEKRWGAVRFVSGGFLIGDKIQVLIDAEAARIRKMGKGELPVSQEVESESNSSSSEEEAAVVEKPKKSKKRKADEIEKLEAEVVAVKIKKSKKKRKMEVVAEVIVTEALEDLEVSEKKSKKNRKSKSEPTSSEDEDGEEVKKRKKEKKDKKERKKKEKAIADVSNAEKISRKEKKSRKDKQKSESSESSTKESTPATPLPAESSGQSTPMMSGRHAVRSRNIAQKRLASMDAASLNQIFMIKSQS